MAKLKMVPTPGVPLNGVEKFMQEFEDIIQRHRLQRSREDDDGRKMLINYLLKAVRPYGLQEMVRTEIQADPFIGKSLPKFNMILRKNAGHARSCQGV
ncbi:hypothetical protein BVRB_038380 [Beta vulgaris subsp. vulgaris]|uniref:Uncharacterized protein n=1 Tax=Beta vulgaris subsp. vulgaris TaxID=3555 RepID=A0A0J7YNQ6_BETVV|nr:hypothetical protein BVRB_038380 [Beta vulgaris subsp. vulgaris]